jgi:hypothetical protein
MRRFGLRKRCKCCLKHGENKNFQYGMVALSIAKHSPSQVDWLCPYRAKHLRSEKEGGGVDREGARQTHKVWYKTTHLRFLTLLIAFLSCQRQRAAIFHEKIWPKKKM